MKAYRINDFETGPRLEDIPRPTPAAGEVRCGIAACGLNFADLLMIRGTYQEKPPLPLTLGMELAGTVNGAGPGVAGSPASGDRVAVYSGQGGLAEYGTFPADRAALPDAMPFDRCRGVPDGLWHHPSGAGAARGCSPGETLLVLGAAGGVGPDRGRDRQGGGGKGDRGCPGARQACRRGQGRGGSPDRQRPTAIFTTGSRRLGGADVVYDPVGGDLFTQAMRATKPGGRILVVGFASGTVPQIAANHLLVKNISVLGLLLGRLPAVRPRGLLTDSLATPVRLVCRGRALKPHISHVLPLDRADEGLELLRSRQSTGKVVITP